MRRWLLLLFALPLFTTINAQNLSLSKYEYWVDRDYDSRISQTLSNAQETINFQIDTHEMAEGIHTVSLHIQDSEGNWSGIVNSSYLVMRPVVYDNELTTICEYWVDGDFEHRRTADVNEGAVASTLDASALTPGTHYLYCRVKDNRGGSSGVLGTYFYVRPVAEVPGGDVVACEYWIDGDRTTKKEVVVTGKMIAFAIDASGLSEGKHLVSLRVKNEAGNFSVVVSDQFYYFKVEERGGTPETCEYWFDHDFAHRQEVAVANGTVMFTADASSQVDGMHLINWRIRDEKGVYSAINSSAYYKYTPVTPAEDIVWYQYWWNERSDLAVRTDITTKGELQFDGIIEVPDYVMNSEGKDVGTAELHLLFCNDKGNLSNIVTEVVEDRIPPVSHMNELPETQVTNMQMLSWGGTDRWAGVKNYTVYIYDNEVEQWNVLVADTTATSMPFYSTEYDHEYKFFVIARDSLDNVEPMKTQAEASVRFMYHDIYPPETTVQVSSENVSAGESVEVTWETLDDANEIQSNTLYYSEDDGPIILWKKVENTTSATFKGNAGSTYHIIVTGQDSEGNIEHPDMSKGVTVKFNQ